MLIKTDPGVIAGYLQDASGFTQGCAERLVIPANESELAEYLAAASLRREAITLAGGRTGVAAGCIPLTGTVLSLEAFDSLGPVERDPGGGIIRAGAAVRLSAVKAAAGQAGLLYGPDPTEKTGTLGGNAATNASGGQCFKYGPTRQHILGLTAVLSTGETASLVRGQYREQTGRLRIPLSSGRVLELQRPILPVLKVSKNAAGYFSQPGMDALDLFIGMDGTLAVITELKLRLLPAPAGSFSLAAFFPTLAAAADCAQLIRNSTQKIVPLLGIDPASLEFMDEHALNLLRPAYQHIPAAARAALLVSQEFAAAEEEEERLRLWSEFLGRQGVPEASVWFAADAKAMDQLQAFRHALPEAVNDLVRHRGFAKVGTDMAVPVQAFPDMLDIYDRGMRGSGLEYLVFGHIGECHLHANVLPRSRLEYERAKALYLDFARAAISFGGTVSAEHGIGKLKHDFLKVMVGEQGLREMARVKRVLDPALILNRGNIFPESYLES